MYTCVRARMLSMYVAFLSSIQVVHFLTFVIVLSEILHQVGFKGIK
jgi:hypothetical protein